MHPPMEVKNPLINWYRQPKIYIPLPSKGEFYPEGTLDVSINRQYPVFAMSAADEILFKTPDALVNGHSTVEVIKSCIPAIKDPWKMPAIDLDAVLVAIRIASYGEKLEISANCPHCDHENNYEIDLNNWLSQFTNSAYQSSVTVGQLEFVVRPYTYFEITQSSLKSFEHQRALEVLSDPNMAESEKLEIFNKSFVEVTKMNIEIISRSIVRIVSPDGATEHRPHIESFIKDADSDTFNQISDHIAKMTKMFSIPEQKVKCGNEECKKEFVMPISLDQSNFFDVRSRR